MPNNWVQVTKQNIFLFTGSYHQWATGQQHVLQGVAQIHAATHQWSWCGSGQRNEIHVGGRNPIYFPKWYWFGLPKQLPFRNFYSTALLKFPKCLLFRTVSELKNDSQTRKYEMVPFRKSKISRVSILELRFFFQNGNHLVITKRYCFRNLCTL